MINHTASIVAQGYKQVNPGPGTGVQLQFQTDTEKNGRLVVPGWGSKVTDSKGSSTRAIVLISEASAAAKPDTWRAVLVPPWAFPLLSCFLYRKIANLKCMINQRDNP